MVLKRLVVLGLAVSLGGCGDPKPQDTSSAASTTDEGSTGSSSTGTSASTTGSTPTDSTGTGTTGTGTTGSGATGTGTTGSGTTSTGTTGTGATGTGGTTATPWADYRDVPMPATANEYAALCSDVLGVVPQVDCGSGVRVPILVDGEEVFEEVGFRRCDDPDIKGACIPGSRVGRIMGSTADGEPLPDVYWVFFCRSQGPAALARGLVSVQMIGHDTASGATCFFESPDAVGSDAHADYLDFDDEGNLIGVLPAPGEPEFDRVFISPRGEACTFCHQADPFLHTPWIDNARLPEDPSQPVLPEVAGPNTPYWVIGGGSWDYRTVHIDGNGCVSCHRAPDPERIFFLSGEDINDFMPPDAPGSMAEDYNAIRRCYDDPTGDPRCELGLPPY